MKSGILARSAICHRIFIMGHFASSCLILLLLLFFLFGNSGSSLLSNVKFAPVNLVLHLLHHFFDFFIPWIHTELSAFHVETNIEKNGCQFHRKKVKIPAFKNHHNYHSHMKTTKLDLVNLKYFMLCLLIFSGFKYIRV